MVNIGIIGCGKIATSHINALAKIPDAKISAVCDVDEEKCRKFARKAGANAYSSYAEMTEKEILSLVIICLPPAFHGDCVRHCAEKKVNIFVEKPMGIDATDCRSMIEACEKNGVMLWVGHMQRYSRENVIAKKLIESGRLGELVAVSEVRSCLYPNLNSPKWLMNKELSGGGIMYNFGAHTMDMIKYITGSSVVSCESAVKLHSDTCENSASGIVRMEDGVVLTFNLIGMCDVNRYEIVLYLTEGEIRINPRERIVACGKDGVFKEVDGEEFGVSDESWMQLQLRDVLDALQTGNVKVSGEYGMEIVKTIENLYLSAGIKINKTEEKKNEKVREKMDNNASCGEYAFCSCCMHGQRLGKQCFGNP